MAGEWRRGKHVLCLYRCWSEKGVRVVLVCTVGGGLPSSGLDKWAEGVMAAVTDGTRRPFCRGRPRGRVEGRECKEGHGDKMIDVDDDRLHLKKCCIIISDLPLSRSGWDVRSSQACDLRAAVYTRYGHTNHTNTAEVTKCLEATPREMD